MIIRTYLADELPSLLAPVRFMAFGASGAWQGWNPDVAMETAMARLPGSGSFYWANAIRGFVAAKSAMRADASIQQVKLETISGREIARLYQDQPVKVAPACDMVKGCTKPVAYVDHKGYVYCAHHGLERKASMPCRKLRASELRKMVA